jgi:hypothetical protein
MLWWRATTTRISWMAMPKLFCSPGFSDCIMLLTRYAPSNSLASAVTRQRASDAASLLLLLPPLRVGRYDCQLLLDWLRTNDTALLWATSSAGSTAPMHPST